MISIRVKRSIREITNFVDLAERISAVIQLEGALDHQVKPKRGVDQRKFPIHGLTPLAGLSCLPSLIGTKEPLTVEMDDVARCLGDPDLGFPCDLGEVLDHGSSREECSHKDQPGLSHLE